MYLLFILPLCGIVSVVVYRKLTSKPLDGILSRIPGPECKTWLKGNMLELFNRQHGPQYHLNLVKNYDRVARVQGFLGDQQLYISDPLALTTVLNRDQDIFEETEVFISNNKIIFGEGLVATIGEHHKRQRKLITPVFSVQRLRRLIPVFYDVAYRLRDALKDKVVDTKPKATNDREYVVVEPGDSKHSTTPGAVVDIAEWMSRAALESIATAGLGHSLDPLNSSSVNAYTKAVKELIPTLFSISLLRLLTPFVIRLGPPSFRRFLLRFVPIKAVHKVRSMADTMEETCAGILRNKRDRICTSVAEKSDDDEKDVLSVLLRANDAAPPGDKMTDAELIGQMNVLIFGAQDTTSSALSRVIQLLTMDTEIQERLRSEIKNALEDNDNRQLDYEALISLPILDAVIRETLRLYSPVPFVRRVARRDATLPLSRPIQLSDGTLTSTVSVPCGTTVWLSIMGVNQSPEVWGPDAARWRPERWLTDLSNTPCGVNSAGAHRPEDDTWLKTAKLKLPGVYPGMLTFLSGGRSCIGYRFALIEMKIILSTIIQSFYLRPTGDRIAWNLSQILSPSAKRISPDEKESDKQGLPVRISVTGLDAFQATLSQS